MNNYEVMDVVEIGNAGDVIQTPKDDFVDEIGGNLGPPSGQIPEDE